MAAGSSTVVPVALVTGGSRGLGLEVCRQLSLAGYKVILTAREAVKAQSAARELAVKGRQVVGQPMDVTSQESVSAAAEMVTRIFGRLDVLVNNAGVGYDPETVASAASLASVQEAIATNLLGAWRVTGAFLPLMRKSGPARIVNVSSEAGSFGGTSEYTLKTPLGALCGFSVTKAALNAMTVKLAAELAGSGLLVNAVCPGWCTSNPAVKLKGARTPEQAATGIVWAATLKHSGPSGGFFRDGKPIAW